MKGSSETDGELLVEAFRELHPDPFRHVDEADLRAAARSIEVDGRRSHVVVELMRLAALLGVRNGHSGIFGFDGHPTTLHAFPLVTYEFADGIFVVASAVRELVGLELRDVAGVPVERLMAAVEPLVPRDNVWTVRARRPAWLATAEVLAGLGLSDGVTAVEFGLDGPSGPLRVTLDPLPAGDCRALFRDEFPARFEGLPRRHGPEWLARSGEPLRTRSLVDGRAVYVAYNVTRGDVSVFAAEVASLADESAKLVVLDLRLNGGGDNRTYGPLLTALERAARRGVAVAVLIGRLTFSAAMQLVVDLEQRTPARFVGEPTGGSPNQYGDARAIDLPASGLRAHVATKAWMTAGEDDPRLSREPDLHVELRSADFFAGHDPVLAAALSILD